MTQYQRGSHAALKTRIENLERDSKNISHSKSSRHACLNLLRKLRPQLAAMEAAEPALVPA